MNEEALPETMSLGEFLEKADVSEWSAAEIWARAELLYPHLAPALAEIKTQFIANSPDEAKAILLRAFERAERELPPQIKSVKSTPERLVAVPARKIHIEKTVQSAGDQRKKMRDDFARRVARKFVENVSIQAAEEKREFENQLADQLIKQKITREGAREAIASSAKKIPEINEAIIQSPAVIESLLDNERSTLNRVDRVEEVINEAAVIALNNQESSPRPDVFLAIAAEKARYTNESADRIIEKSAGLARAATAVNADISGLGDLSGSGTFFQSFAKSGLEKAVAPAADALLDMVARVNPPAAKAFVERVIDASVARVVKNTEQTTQAIIDRVGAAAAQSSLVQSTIQQWAQQVDQHGGASGIAKARSVFDDLAGAIFGKRIDEGVLDYTELIRLQFIKSDQLPTWQQIHVIGIVQHQPHLVHFEPVGEAGSWALSWFSGAIAQKTGGKVASTIVGAAATEASKKAAAAFLVKIGLGSVTGGTGFVIQAAAQAGFWLGGKIRDFAGFLFSGQWITNLMSQVRAAEGRASWRSDTPKLVAWGVVIGLVLFFLFPWFFNFNYMNRLVDYEALVPGLGGAVRPGPEGSGYIKLAKTPSPDSFPDNNPGDVTYTITIQASGGDLSNIAVSDTFSVFGGSKNISAPALSGIPTALTDGETYSTTIVVSLAGLRNSLVTNELVITADVKTSDGRTLSGERRSTSASVTIGEPPTGCFVFGEEAARDAWGRPTGAWDNKSDVLAAIMQLTRSAPLMARLCAGGPIKLYRVHANFGGGSVSSANEIFLYNMGVVNLSATYTLAHESGHILKYRSNLFQEYYNEGLSKREGYIWTYPNDYSLDEDFAETLGAYVVYGDYVFGRRGTKMDYPKEYPLHYEFAKRVYGIEY